MRCKKQNAIEDLLCTSIAFLLLVIYLVAIRVKREISPIIKVMILIPIPNIAKILPFSPDSLTSKNPTTLISPDMKLVRPKKVKNEATDSMKPITDIMFIGVFAFLLLVFLSCFIGFSLICIFALAAGTFRHIYPFSR